MGRRKSPSPTPSVIRDEDYVPWEHEVSDDVRVAIETPQSGELGCAQYTITPLGRVYRNDGHLMLPSSAQPFGAHKVNMNSGTNCRSLPKLVAETFNCYQPTTWVTSFGSEILLHAWVDPEGPYDPETGRLRHSVFDVVLVPHGEIIRYHRGTLATVKTRIPIIPPGTPNNLD